MWAASTAYKLISNFKGFYNEINSATLTGAIDVIIVQQEDGSYVSSPFHVRFGKTGVLRAREKVVDIEINGEPVDLHMKLGDAGEAFFVQQSESKGQIPAHLATSPIDLDAETLMELGIKKLKKESEKTSTEIQIFDETTKENESNQSIVVAHNPNFKQSGSQTEGLYDEMWHKSEVIFAELSVNNELKKENSTDSSELSHSNQQTPVAGIIRDESQASLYYSVADLDSPMRDPGGIVTVYKNKVDVCIQTDMSGPEIESKAIVSDRVRTLSEVGSNSSRNENSTPTSIRSEKSEPPSISVTITHSKIRTESTSSNVSKKDGDSSLSTTPTRKQSNSNILKPKPMLGGMTQRDSEASLLSLHSQASVETYTTKSTQNTNKKKVQKRRRRRSKVSESRESGSSNDTSSIPDGGMFDIDIENDEVDSSALLNMTTMGRSVSMPFSGTNISPQDNLEVDKHKMTAEWAKSQFASHSHPWSDADITPIMSPISSRPPSPKSDTEYEIQKLDVCSQTSITGLGQEINKLEDLTWQWGELPTPAATPDRDQPHDSEKSQDESKPTGGLFQFMRKTKKIRHQPEKEGIYLEDLNLEEMDPEVAALYLYGNKSSQTSDGSHLKNPLTVVIDEDNESGRGASLPQSPVSMDSQAASGHGIFRPLAHKAGISLPEVSMSLCGGLKDKESSEAVFHDKFQQRLVTYDDFCANPNMLTDQNLVIKIDNKYYNYAMAGPIFMGYLAFNRALPEAVVDLLVKQQMPKKESRRRGWFSWGRGNENEPGESLAINKSTPTSSPPTSVPNSPQKHKIKKEGSKGGGDSSDEGEDEAEPGLTQSDKMEPEEGPKLGTMVKSQSMSGIDDYTAEALEMKTYEKSLKLSSEQVEKLTLKPGKNVAHFSVTTQYQGTAKCQAHIYLWKWDTKIIISDVDGTITKSDVLGHVLPLVGKDWSQEGITALFNEIDHNGYQFIYLSARAIGQAGMTRDYLRSVTQEKNMKLPEGPLLLSPNSLVRAFHKEVIEKKPEEFKIGCLKNIKDLFPQNPFYAGFGNKVNDAFAYRNVGIPMSRIFTVNHRGELRMELITNFLSSYTKLSDIVDMFFPPLIDLDTMKLGCIHPRIFPAADEYSSFTYWREPLPDVSIEMDEITSNEKKDGNKSK